MFDEEDDDFQDQLDERTKSLQQQLKARARKEFIDGCYTAYEILERDGKKALDQGDLSSICRAINRMMSLFLVKEEYEKCSFLKKYVEQNIPGHTIDPDPIVAQQLSDI